MKGNQLNLKIKPKNIIGNLLEAILLLCSFSLPRFIFLNKVQYSDFIRDLTFYSLFISCGFIYRIIREKRNPFVKDLLLLNVISFITFIIGTSISDLIINNYYRDNPQVYNIYFIISYLVTSLLLIDFGYIFSFFSIKLICHIKTKKS